ncbi:MAG: hypothetical protein K940chlam8_00613 [Chlamydiae bacterium]|nr:hypothetical protein [Chlamydiota bacterium]
MFSQVRQYMFGQPSQSEQVRQLIKLRDDKKHIVVWTTNNITGKNFPENMHFLPGISSFESEYNIWNNDVALKLKQLSLVLNLDEQSLQKINISQLHGLKFKNIHILLTDINNEITYTKMLTRICDFVHVYFYNNDEISLDQLNQIKEIDEKVKCHTSKDLSETFQSIMFYEQDGINELNGLIDWGASKLKKGLSTEEKLLIFSVGIIGIISIGKTIFKR